MVTVREMREMYTSFGDYEDDFMQKIIPIICYLHFQVSTQNQYKQAGATYVVLQRYEAQQWLGRITVLGLHNGRSAQPIPNN